MPAYSGFRDLLSTTQPDSQSLLRAIVHTKLELRTGMSLSRQSWEDSIDEKSTGIGSA